MNAALAALQSLLQQVPVKYRAKVYSVLGVLSAVATLVVLVFANHDALGVEIPDRWVAIATGASALLGLLARANTPARTTIPDNHADPFGEGHAPADGSDA